MGYTDSLKYESITHATYEQVNSRPPHSSTGNIKFYKDESIKKCLLPADVNGGESPALMEHIDDDVVAEMCESSENCQCGVCQQLAWTSKCLCYKCVFHTNPECYFILQENV